MASVALVSCRGIHARVVLGLVQVHDLTRVLAPWAVRPSAYCSRLAIKWVRTFLDMSADLSSRCIDLEAGRVPSLEGDLLREFGSGPSRLREEAERWSCLPDGRRPDQRVGWGWTMTGGR
jgi:hypothetical protein